MKSEAPIIAVFFIFSIIISLYFYPRILWYSFLIFPLMALSYWVLKTQRLGIFKKDCFLILDEEGIRYCFHLFQAPKFLRWEQVDRVNYQMYEINFKLKESGEVISMQTSYLENIEEFSDLQAMINAKCKIM